MLARGPNLLTLKKKFFFREKKGMNPQSKFAMCDGGGNEAEKSDMRIYVYVYVYICMHMRMRMYVIVLGIVNGIDQK